MQKRTGNKKHQWEQLKKVEFISLEDERIEEELTAEERRVKSKFYTGLIVFCSAALLVALLFLAAWFLFDVEKIEVEGNELYSDELIAAQVLDDEHSWNALYVFLKYKFKKPETMPFIAERKVQLKGRNTVVIQVYEKELVGYAYVESTGQYAYFDKDGIVVERSTNIIEDVAYIEGLNVTEVSLYEKLQVEDDSVFRDLLDITQELQKNSVMPEKITLKERENFELSYGDIVVNFGQAEYIHGKVVHMIEILKLLEGKTGILHMENWKNDKSSSPFEETTSSEKNE